MFDDFYDKIEKEYNLDLSYGGKVERSFWKNVGNIVNKRAIFEQNQTVFTKIVDKANKYIKGENLWKQK